MEWSDEWLHTRRTMGKAEWTKQKQITDLRLVCKLIRVVLKHVRLCRPKIMLSPVKVDHLGNLREENRISHDDR